MPRKLGLPTLVATTFFIVSGGPYGLEEIVSGYGYARTLLLLSIVPLVWSLPVALMVGELSAAIPEEGGYYAWVRRALGPFAGAFEAWLSLATSFFDMAIYPTLFVTYLGRAHPVLLDTAFGRPGWFLGVAMIAACAAWNLRGSRAVAVGAEVLGAILLAPFVIMLVLAVVQYARHDAPRAHAMLSAPPPPNAALGAGVLLCMWNYMGWDNASTIALEVESPQRTYPRAMLLTLALVVACYLLPTLAAATTGLLPVEWTAGSWVEVARRLGGRPLAFAVVAGGALSALGMFNALVLSYSRLPVAMAGDGMLPRALAKHDERTGAPRLAIVLAAVLYASCLGLGLKRLVEIDVVLYGIALLLELVALVVLRVREPALARPFRIPLGLPGVIAVCILPMLLLAAAAWAGRKDEGLLGLSAVGVSVVVAAGCAAMAFVQALLRSRKARPEEGA